MNSYGLPFPSSANVAIAFAGSLDFSQTQARINHPPTTVSSLPLLQQQKLAVITEMIQLLQVLQQTWSGGVAPHPAPNSPHQGFAGQGFAGAYAAQLAPGFQASLAAQAQANAQAFAFAQAQFAVSPPLGAAGQFGLASHYGASNHSGLDAYYGSQAMAGQATAMAGYPASGFPGSPYGNEVSAALAAALNFGYREVPGEVNKMWDVWFDSRDGQKTVQRSPIVLDLNKNGKADITGKNILGDGKIDGPTTLFDLDPSKVSFEFKSQQRRPGSGAPSVSGGYWVDAAGNKTEKTPPKGTQKGFNGYQYLDKDGNLVGQMKEDGLYHYGKQEKREETEWLAKNGGDGFLVADFNNNGEIDSAIELFGTVGLDGKEKYKNGYEKLADLFDKNRDGVVTGEELKGLKIWVDSNADGKVQAGELQSLAEHNITSFDVRNYDSKTMEGSYRTGGGPPEPYLDFSLALSIAAALQSRVPSGHSPYFPAYPWAYPYG